MLALRRLVTLALVAAPLSCDSRNGLEAGSGLAGEREGAPSLVETQPAEPDRSGYPKIVALGDSLTAGYGIAQDEAYPAQLQRKLDAAGLEYEVVNAGVSGETTAGGRRRLSWVLDGRDVRALVLALGGNDGLRGLSPSEMKENLRAMIEEARGRGIRVLVCGMVAPPNQGEAYTGEFRRVFRDLAEEEGVPLLPFLLDGVAGDPSLNQSDGIHPNPDGAAVLADNVYSALKPLLSPPETPPAS